MAVIPRCASCQADTSANIACQPLDHHYQIYYCTSCGAVYGIVPGPTFLAAAEITSPEAAPVVAPMADIPICPHHNLPLKQQTVPAGNRDAGKRFWVCPKVKECHQYWEITPEPGIPQPGKTDSQQLILAEVGEADLSVKDPVSPERMRAKMRAMQLFRPGTRYMRVAYDPGPPFCPEHKLEMKEFTIPEGYKNAGRKIWRCPKYKECHKWELAE